MNDLNCACAKDFFYAKSELENFCMKQQQNTLLLRTYDQKRKDKKKNILMKICMENDFMLRLICVLVDVGTFFVNTTRE